MNLVFRLLGVSLLPSLVCLLGLLAPAASLDAQEVYTLSAGSIQVAPGGVATVPVTLDSSLGAEVSGWSYGLCHDSTAATLLNAGEGAATATSNAGSMPEFHELASLADGYTHAAIICFSLCAALPLGTAHELSVAQYQSLGASGTATPIDFCASLGSPPVELVIVNQQTAEFVPQTESGSIEVVMAPLTGLACSTSADGCGCEYALTWINGGVQDSIEVRVDGTLIQTLAGTDTSVVLPELALLPGEGAVRTLCLTPIVGGIAGASSCCDLACDLDPAPTAGSLIATGVLPSTGGCAADLIWSGFAAASAATFAILIDGVEVASGLTGGAAQIDLPSAGPHEVCVVATDGCALSASACATVECVTTPVTSFRRADSNLDGSVNLADGIRILSFLFVGGISLGCMDAADANDDSSVDISDAIFLFAYLFTGGAPPPAPGFSCGEDPTDGDPFGCDDTGPCP